MPGFTGHKVWSGKVLSTVADREGIITGRREVLGAWFFAKKPGTGTSWPPPLSLLKEIFSYDKALNSDLRWAVAVKLLEIQSSKL
jgi:hypothetical protein